MAKFEIPGFSIRKVIQETPNGAVFRAERQADGEFFILKYRSHIDRDLRSVQQLRHAHSVMEQLDSPFIVKSYGLLDVEGGLVHICEDFEAISLEDARLAPMNSQSFVELAIAMCDALIAMHSKNFVHKDLKPSNFIYNPRTKILKLTDFGTSAHLPFGAQLVDPSSMIEGTLAFISPEQTGRMNRSLDFRADLYSLGISFYQLLTGKLPFDAQDPLGWIHCHIAKQAIPPHEIRSTIPVILSRMVMRLLAKRADDRYQDARSLKMDLLSFLRFGFNANMQLGQQDQIAKFRVSQKIVGRDAELRTLQDEFHNAVAAQQSRVVTVSGYSGIGKTTLVNELQHSIVRASGFLAAGKFDQYKRDIPLATIAEAFRKLVQQILSTNDHELDAWNSRLQKSLGNNGRVLTDIFPELELIMGAQPPVPELDPAEVQNRFNLTFINFLKVLASEEHPLVVFLDDLQWADNGTLNLIETISTRPDVGHLFFILSYRDNEVNETHPLALTLGAMERAQVRMHHLVLKPLPDDAVELIIGDMLGAKVEQVRPLAQLVTARTQGNPFFTIEFLKTLYKDHILSFESARGEWTWDAAKIEAMGISANVVDLMLHRIATMRPACQFALKLAAAIGNSCRVEDLAKIASKQPEQVLLDLQEAIDEGLVLVVRNRESATLRFHHDRIHQSAYTLVSEAEQAALHLEIARLLISLRGRAEVEADVFEIVNHYQKGLRLLRDPKEMQQLMLLSLMAGKKSKNATAYRTALTYLRLAKELCSRDFWSSSYKLALDLHLEMAECLFLAGDLSQSEELFAMTLQNATNDLDRAKVYYLQLKLFQVAGRYKEAAEISLLSFRIFGCDLQESTANDVFMAEVERCGKLREGRSIESLLDLPQCTDPGVKSLLALLEASAPPLYMAMPGLFPVIVMKMVNYSLEYGNAPASCYGYAVYGLLLAAAFGDPTSGLDFVNMSVTLNERYRDPKLKGAVLHILGDHVNFWKRPMSSSVGILERGFAACLEAGDLIYSNYIAFQGVWQAFERGETLDDMSSDAKRYADFSLQAKHIANYKTVLLERQFARALQGLTASPTELSDEQFDAKLAYKEIVDATFSCGIVYHDIIRQILYFFDRQFDKSIEAADDAAKTLSAALSMPIYTSYYMFRMLAQCARWDSLNEASRAIVAKECEGALTMHRAWARECPENFAGRLALMEAEWARVQGGERREALAFYEKARRHPIEIKWMIALACELEGRFHMQRDSQQDARQCFAEAKQAYEGWGASSKAQGLSREFPQFALGSNHRKFSTSTMAQSLDALAILKASQSLSSEIELDKLLPKLVHVVMELTGAEDCALVLFEENKDRLETFASVNMSLRDRNFPMALKDGADLLPVSLVNYVKRSGERYLLNPESDHPFRQDTYFQIQNPMALLCVPIVKQNRILGTLVLSNLHFADAFAAGKQSALDPILTQVAISIENATLFARLQTENLERQRKEAALKQSEQHMRLVTNALPALIAYVDFLGNFQSANSAFKDWFGLEEQEVVGFSMSDVWGDDLMQVIMPYVDQALSGHKQEFIAQVKFPDLRMRDIHATYVPDIDKGKVRGFITLVNDITERRRDESERMRMQAAEQAALEASRIKSEFLANMSHEIRTPISGVIGLTELLLDTSLSGEQQDFAENIKRSGEMLLTVINDILDFSKMEAGKLDFEHLPFSVGQSLKDTVQTLKFMADKKGIGLIYDISADIPAHCVGDSGRVRQILSNLIGNAIKFTGQGHVAVSAKQESVQGEKAVIRFEVKDTGIGIPAHVLPRLFSSFTQADSSTARRFGGTGLGLSIAKHLVERMGGKIAVTSVQGEGSTFWFTLCLPLAKNEKVANPKAAQHSTDEHKVIGKILLAEDNPVNQTIAVRMLQKMGHEVEVVGNGVLALNALQNGRYDVVLMDCQMPEMDGYETSSTIRKSSAWFKDIPIIALTANAMSGDGEKCIAAGMNDYLSKPINSERLGAMIRAWVLASQKRRNSAA